MTASNSNVVSILTNFPIPTIIQFVEVITHAMSHVCKQEEQNDSFIWFNLLWRNSIQCRIECDENV